MSLSTVLTACLAFVATGMAQSIFPGPQQCVKTVTVKFDTLPVGSSPPNGYGGLNWSGWTVINAADHQFTANTKPNLLQGPLYGTTITTTGDTVWSGIAVQTLYFGSTELINSVYRELPANSSLSIFNVYNSEGDYQTPVAIAGPYSFGINNTAPYQKLAKIHYTVNQQYQASLLGLFLSTAQAEQTIVIDTLVYQYQNETCYYANGGP